MQVGQEQCFPLGPLAERQPWHRPAADSVDVSIEKSYKSAQLDKNNLITAQSRYETLIGKGNKASLGSFLLRIHGNFIRSHTTLQIKHTLRNWFQLKSINEDNDQYEIMYCK